ncbi:hypothetical protein FFZ99_12655 [Leptospira interrogans]|nr:hypothetical protein B2G47_16485 [Leptospira interrogans serovar Canicola]EJO77782.1 hypothetical protein LEP1GSC045_1325 [Leptospira interrogans serovar Pomona str. Kennewicki LC82-25]EKN96383.1 hypothetical protein LEP1GSC014_0633 [Leptospira interrogans serovar Pomona str. Pomona]EKO71082.1 hypothetical protein LEP1GSC069_2398 [Leptospira interrogans serovar Canicola str. Fiocruz LV133]EKR38144.1 hypothetical protein LEP1GSC096_0858 [Leptospira interrogans serovar Hebdomadis str. R499]EM
MVFEKFNQSKGGQFSKIDIVLKNLNSNRNKLPFIDKVNFCEFITDSLLKSAYENYSKTLSNERINNAVNCGFRSIA